MSYNCYRLFEISVIKYVHQEKIGGEEGMIKSKREQELELENKRLKKENELLKKTLKIQKKQLKNANELIEDLQKENKIKEYNEAMRKNSLLKEELKKLQEKIEDKEVTIQNLTVQLKKDSTNSSKPSSTDNIYTKKPHIVSSRQAGGKNGGQWKHKGATFTKEELKKIIEEAKKDKNKKVRYEVKEIGNKKSGKYKSKYEVDVEVVTTITEYRYYEDEDGEYNIPKNKEAEVQYGSTARALMCYFTTEMMAPLNKTRSFFKQITNGIFKLSEGTIVNTQKALDKRLTPIVEEIKERLKKAEVLHVDETRSKNKWHITLVTYML